MAFIFLEINAVYLEKCTLSLLCFHNLFMIVSFHLFHQNDEYLLGFTSSRHVALCNFWSLSIIQ